MSKIEELAVEQTDEVAGGIREYATATTAATQTATAHRNREVAASMDMREIKTVEVSAKRFD